MKQRPVVLGLSLCEQVIIEEKTRNYTLVNCFTHRRVATFPSNPLPFVAFAVLSDGMGNTLMEAVVERLDTMDEIDRISQSVNFSDPLQTMRCTIRMQKCVFPVPGHYQVSLIADGEAVAQRKMIVLAEEKNT